MDKEFLQQVSDYVASSLEALKAEQDARVKLACDLNAANSEISRLNGEIRKLSGQIKVANSTSTNNLSLAIEIIDQCRDKGFIVADETYKVASKIAKDPVEALTFMGNVLKTANVSFESGRPCESTSESFSKVSSSSKSLQKVAEILSLKSKDSDREFNFYI